MGSLHCLSLVSGPETILTKDEELCLVEWATKLVRVGFPTTDDDFLDQVEKIKKRERLLKEQQKIAADKKKKRRKHC